MEDRGKRALRLIATLPQSKSRMRDRLINWLNIYLDGYIRLNARQRKEAHDACVLGEVNGKYNEAEKIYDRLKNEICEYNDFLEHLSVANNLKKFIRENNIQDTKEIGTESYHKDKKYSRIKFTAASRLAEAAVKYDDRCSKENDSSTEWPEYKEFFIALDDYREKRKLKT